MSDEVEVLDFDDPEEIVTPESYQPNQALRPLVDELQNKMKDRIRWGNRIAAATSGNDNVSASYLRYYEYLFSRAQEDEEKIREIIRYEVSQFEIFDYMEKIKGLGSNISAYLISMIDITIPKTPSALWRYSGYGVSWYYQDGEGKIVAPQQGYQFKKVDPRLSIPEEYRDFVEGEVKAYGLEYKEVKVKVQVIPQPRPEWVLVQVRDRPVTGWLLPYNKRLKTHLYNLGRSFLKSNSPYRVIYDLAKEQYLQRGLTQKVNNEKMTWNKAHADMAAQRKMLKVFLCHFWLTWRIIENLPVTNLYVHDRLGHRDIYLATDFGWPNIGQDNALKSLPMPEGYNRPQDLKHKKVRPVKLPEFKPETGEVNEITVEVIDSWPIPMEEDYIPRLVSPESGTYVTDTIVLLPSPTVEDRPLKDIMLSTRAYNSLKRAGFTMVGQVVDDIERGGKIIRRLNGLGANSLLDLYRKLIAFGYIFAVDEKSNQLYTYDLDEGWIALGEKRDSDDAY